MNNTKQKWIMNKTEFLSRLGSALIYPLSFLAFVSIFMGVGNILPTQWFITRVISDITSIIFNWFWLFTFISLIIVFQVDKDEYTVIKSLIYIAPVIAITYSINNYYGINISYSIFTSLILVFTFIFIYKYEIWSWMWMLIGTGMSVLLIPTFVVVNILIILIGKLISILPWGLSAFTYGAVNRLLVPFGLHSVMIPTFAWSNVGGYMEVYNSTGEIVKTISGDSPIWQFMYANGIKDFNIEGTFVFNSIDYTYKVLNTNVVGQYQEGFLPIIGFTFPILGLGYCLIRGFDKGWLLLMGTLMTMFSGVTETTEFTFILYSPILYIVNSVIVGTSFMLCNILDVHVWLSTGWCIDILLFGIVPSVKGFDTNWYWIPLIGTILGFIYLGIFILAENKTFTI